MCLFSFRNFLIGLSKFACFSLPLQYYSTCLEHLLRIIATTTSIFEASKMANVFKKDRANTLRLSRVVGLNVVHMTHFLCQTLFSVNLLFTTTSLLLGKEIFLRMCIILHVCFGWMHNCTWKTKKSHFSLFYLRAKAEHQWTVFLREKNFFCHAKRT